ncbi:MAG TPA: PepSY domain-containing protein, partial [Solirubrobacterales bacterium]|nr:PepSY domain-containing protein [Solirubrobacterales bacterium]
MLLVALLIFSLGWCGAAGAAGKVTEQEAIAAADRDSKVEAEREDHPALAASAAFRDGRWEVGYFEAGEELVVAIVDPRSGEVLESWTGYQVAWKMARGYSGAFGHKLDAPYVFLPLCALFLLGLLDWRRLRRLANLDLLVLLGFGVSHYFFNRAEIGVSVPLVSPVLAF